MIHWIRQQLADGIIVYRVNPIYKDEGNLRGNDYIYVYRPNDTSITASAGEIGKAQIGLPVYSAARQEIGSLDLNQTIRITLYVILTAEIREYISRSPNRTSIRLNSV